MAGDTVRAGHHPRGLLDSEIVQGEPTLDRRAQRTRFDHWGVPGIGEGDAGIPGAVRGIAQHRQILGQIRLRRDQRASHHGLVIVRTRGPGQPAAGEQSCVRLDGDMTFVAILLVRHGLVHMPRLGIDNRDHPI